MARLSIINLIRVTVVCLITLNATAAPDEHLVHLGIDLAITEQDSNPSWMTGSVGKLSEDSSISFQRAFVDYRFRVTDTFSTHLAAEAYDDSIGDVVGITEAYVHWRPVPKSPVRKRLKVGVFHPRVSLENTQPGWGSRFTQSFSAINSWIAEEVRAIGAELELSTKPPQFGGKHRLSLYTAVFGGNDPAGSLLAWRGWSMHDRQTRLGDRLPLASLPLNGPGLPFSEQADYVAPFREIDDRFGYYVSGEWRSFDGVIANILHYDNRGDPTKLESGQYAWATKFTHIGFRIELPKDFSFITQWIKGNTAMGPKMGGVHAVDNDFDSKFFLLSKSLNQHRITIRYDDFNIDEKDFLPQDPNEESGYAFTTNYKHHLANQFNVTAEWLYIKSRRPAREFNGFSTTEKESQIQVRFEASF